MEKKLKSTAFTWTRTYTEILISAFFVPSLKRAYFGHFWHAVPLHNALLKIIEFRLEIIGFFDKQSEI